MKDDCFLVATVLDKTALEALEALIGWAEEAGEFVPPHVDRKSAMIREALKWYLFWRRFFLVREGGAAWGYPLPKIGGPAPENDISAFAVRLDEKALAAIDELVLHGKAQSLFPPTHPDPRSVVIRAALRNFSHLMTPQRHREIYHSGEQ